jgi:hypothetical protein
LNSSESEFVSELRRLDVTDSANCDTERRREGAFGAASAALPQRKQGKPPFIPSTSARTHAHALAAPRVPLGAK